MTMKRRCCTSDCTLQWCLARSNRRVYTNAEKRTYKIKYSKFLYAFQRCKTVSYENYCTLHLFIFSNAIVRSGIWLVSWNCSNFLDALIFLFLIAIKLVHEEEKHYYVLWRRYFTFFMERIFYYFKSKVVLLLKNEARLLTSLKNCFYIERIYVYWFYTFCWFPYGNFFNKNLLKTILIIHFILARYSNYEIIW